MNALRFYTETTARIVAEYETAQRFLTAALAEGMVAPALLEAFQKAQAANEVAETVAYLFNQENDAESPWESALEKVQAWIQRELLYPSTGRFASTEADRAAALRTYARLAI